MAIMVAKLGFTVEAKNPARNVDKQSNAKSFLVEVRIGVQDVSARQITYLIIN